MGRAAQPFGGRKHWWADLLVGATVIWFACLGLDAMAATTDAHDEGALLQSLGQTIAAEERDRVERLDFDRLVPTEGFVAPEWIDHEGLAPGEVGLVTHNGPDVDASARHIYTVAWKVEKLDRHGSLRRATVSVHWQQPDGTLGRIVTSVLRAGGHTA